MLFFHKPYYNFNYTNPIKKNLNDICPKPKKLYKVYKLNNAKQKNIKKHRKKNFNQILKLLNYKYLFIEKNLNLQNNQINFVKTKRKDRSLTFV